MKKIAYIELDTHAEIAGNFLDLMQDSKEFAIDYYFSERVMKHVGKRNSTIHLSKSTALLNQMSGKDYDLVIIGTVHRYFNLFNEITERFNTSVIVHNVNFTRISRFQLFKNIFKKDFQYRLKLWLKEELLSAPKVFEKAKNLLVLDESLTKETFRFLPLFYFKEYKFKKESILNIVIPGAVDQMRRDYKKVLSKLKSFESKTQFKIYFLGKAKDQELQWLKKFDKNKPSNLALVYFTEKVPQREFDEIMQSADLLWCPIQSETSFFSNTEIYGKTKMSGNIGDAIKYGKKALFPRSFVSAYPFLIPESDDIEEQILESSKTLEFDFEAAYHREKITAELEKVLNSLF